MENGNSDLDSERRVPTGNRSYRFGRPLLTPPRPYWEIENTKHEYRNTKQIRSTKYEGCAFYRTVWPIRLVACQFCSFWASPLSGADTRLQVQGDIRKRVPLQPWRLMPVACRLFQASSPGVEPGLRPSHGRVPPSHSEDRLGWRL